jgi:hypothetical protein
MIWEFKLQQSCTCIHAILFSRNERKEIRSDRSGLQLNFAPWRLCGKKSSSPFSNTKTLKGSIRNQTPKTIEASISNFLLISRATFKVGSLFPLRYSLILEVLIPRNSDSVF